MCVVSGLITNEIEWNSMARKNPPVNHSSSERKAFLRPILPKGNLIASLAETLAKIYSIQFSQLFQLHLDPGRRNRAYGHQGYCANFDLKGLMLSVSGEVNEYEAASPGFSLGAKMLCNRRCLPFIGEQRCPRNTTWRSATCCPSRVVLPSLTPDIYNLDNPGEVEACDIPFTSTPIRNGSICLVSKSGKMEQESCVDGKGQGSTRPQEKYPSRFLENNSLDIGTVLAAVVLGPLGEGWEDVAAFGVGPLGEGWEDVAAVGIGH
ncbi:hypothetical protein TNIN_344991 [Trichonephila inaurata madagascariensis]|uniref:Uncharacterized protein n=1 Tax=Trichonephila inaurata madagascariensis TaxID=2747483 RepID=A0A8X7C9F5_9ARAC|nr:hypothetical protein TNIN_344991 [Trichonephila inaurata madagascariensis]